MQDQQRSASRIPHSYFVGHLEWFQMRKHLFLAILLILPLHVSCFQDAQPEKKECAYAGWSTPLTIGVSLDYFATPSLVVQDDSVYVAAPLATPPQSGRGYVLRSLGGIVSCSKLPVSAW